MEDQSAISSPLSVEPTDPEVAYSYITSTQCRASKTKQHAMVLVNALNTMSAEKHQLHLQLEASEAEKMRFKAELDRLSQVGHAAQPNTEAV